MIDLIYEINKINTKNNLEMAVFHKQDLGRYDNIFSSKNILCLKL